MEFQHTLDIALALSSKRWQVSNRLLLLLLDSRLALLVQHLVAFIETVNCSQ